MAPPGSPADYGIDITQLRDNLALPVAERLCRHQITLNTVEKLERANPQKGPQTFGSAVVLPLRRLA